MAGLDQLRLGGVALQVGQRLVVGQFSVRIASAHRGATFPPGRRLRLGVMTSS